VELQRVGGYNEPVRLSVVGDLPPGVADATFDDGGLVPGGTVGAIRGLLTVTFDPSPPDGPAELTIQAVGDGAGAAQATVHLRFDRTPPVVEAPWPSAVLRPGRWSGEAPVRFSWSASDAWGLARLELQRAVGGGGWLTRSRPSATATSSVSPVARGSDQRWRLRAVDLAGNVGTSSPLGLRLLARETSGPRVERSAGWTIRTVASASGRNLSTATGPGRTAQLAFQGRSVAIVAPTGTKDAGRFRVRIDGRPVGTVDLRSGWTRVRRIVFTSAELAPGPHVIRIVTLSGRVDLDTILVLR
jgi:hypothetical protein